MLITILTITGIGYILYSLMDDEHKRVVRYLLSQVKHLPDRYML